MLQREAVRSSSWNSAAHEAPPQNLAPGPIVAGDVNGLGMEPAAISGIYAANKILGKTVD